MVAEQVSAGCLLEGLQRVGDLAKVARERQRAAGAKHRGGDHEAFSLRRATGQPGQYQQGERPRGWQGARTVVQDRCGKFFQQGAGV
jgi:hypothetical protein